ncbi:hypothetical protein [Pseudothauera rhizosphaerae]|uniref:Uncharacterized protein n=1 Tax=Pseudothauera rhizosphaerae TaxID=2565932 RepID=A0A4S4AQH1_9RHOO|nr:hypothetical protein [Pseudothauera rhizosphaerae]THF61974.1 hypothetical protein E6O51_07360 [Pseudothauera rhizosphaerae]
MELKDIITAIAALVGMVLGIYNYLHARAADRVRLRVVPKSSSYQGKDFTGREFYLHNKDRFDIHHPTYPPDTLSVEVVNLSKFPVTVDEIGLRSRWRKTRLVLVNPVLADRGPWPRKLEPRESVTASFDLTSLIDSDHLPSVTHAYATTICGSTCLGESGALKELVLTLKNAA